MLVSPDPHRQANREVLVVIRCQTEETTWFEGVAADLNAVGLSMARSDSFEEAIHRVEQGGLAGAALFGDATYIDGLSLMRFIRSIDRWLPAWLVVADVSPRTVRAAFELRVNGVMNRPVAPGAFCRTLTKALSRPVQLE